MYLAPQNGVNRLDDPREVALAQDPRHLVIADADQGPPATAAVPMMLLHCAAAAPGCTTGGVALMRCHRGPGVRWSGHLPSQNPLWAHRTDFHGSHTTRVYIIISSGLGSVPLPDFTPPVRGDWRRIKGAPHTPSRENTGEREREGPFRCR